MSLTGITANSFEGVAQSLDSRDGRGPSLLAMHLAKQKAKQEAEARERAEDERRRRKLEKKSRKKDQVEQTADNKKR